MVSIRSRPPCAAGGIFVNSMIGFAGACCVRQPAARATARARPATKNAEHIDQVRLREMPRIDEKLTRASSRLAAGCLYTPIPVGRPGIAANSIRLDCKRESPALPAE